LVVAVFSLIIYYWARAVALPAEITNAYIAAQSESLQEVTAQRGEQPVA
jgi:hypothetical protein